MLKNNWNLQFSEVKLWKFKKPKKLFLDFSRFWFFLNLKPKKPKKAVTCKRHDQHACSIRPEDETPTIRQHDTRFHFNVSSKADIRVGLIYRAGPQTKKVEKKKNYQTKTDLLRTIGNSPGSSWSQVLSVSFRLKLCEGGFIKVFKTPPIY